MIRYAVLFAVTCFVLNSNPVSAENWSRFRGDNGTGVSDQKGIPTSWSAGNYKWNIELPGVGHAAPIVWGDKLFVTAASERGLVRRLLCLDPATGKENWQVEIAMSDSHKHSKSSWASSTPVTDGKLIYVAHADIERYLVTAYDFDGKLAWRRSLGEYESQHNIGVSLCLFEDMLICPKDQRGPSRIIALDTATGETRWSTLRSFRETSYATPIVVPDKDGKPQLICVSGNMGITSLNPYTGIMNWQGQTFPLRTVASPVYGNGLLIASCGQGGRFGVQQMAVSLDGELDENGLAKIVWERKKVIPYVPTPVVYGEHLYEWSDEGIVACVNLTDGTDVWVKRLGGNFSGSPICIDGKLYCMAEDGEVVVIAASPEFKELGRTPLDDPSHSTPAIANGRLFLRSFHRLACLEAKGT
ncbi:MAG: PQQ-binding-like beta-propeller repeat protein [Planctomycetota bacterium]|nr:PQQ-binding-like beta-propeller repeat protein [Planctomycetota bacterium]MDA1162669.1 PQQ-binding-like beta-propeller repeat protein [Planctomycetota bacterium]